MKNTIVSVPKGIRVSCGVLLLTAFAIAAPGQEFALREGGTVVFYGDSITAQRLYTKDVEVFVLTRYPNLHVRFFNAGVPGDTVYGGYAGAMRDRVKRDVTPFHPTMLTVMLGMNDGGYVPEDPKIDATFQKGYHELLDALHDVAPDAAVTLISPSPYDEITHGTEFPGYSHVLDVNAEDVSEIASQPQANGNRKYLFADAHTPLTEVLKRASSQFPQLAPLIIPDRIHPGEIGHWVMAAALLSAWHVDPIVSLVALKATGVPMVAEKERTAVSDIATTDTGLRWTQLDEALPLPLDLNNAMTAVLLKVSKIESVDQQFLRVEALRPGSYELFIDSKSVASFTSEELNRGVNLALYKTPMLDQARGIDWNEDRRGSLDQARFILSAEVKATPATGAAETTLRQAGEELADNIRTNLAPKPHHFELRGKER